MQKVIVILATLCCVLIVLSCSVWGQSRNDGVRLFNEAQRLWRSARSNEDLRTVVQRFEEALTIFRKVGEVRGAGDTLNNLGVIYEGWGQYSKAVECIERSLAIDRKIGDRRNEGQSLRNLGNIYSEWRQYSRAVEYYEKSLAVCKKVGDLHGRGVTLEALGQCYSARGQHDKALEYFEGCLELFRKIGSEKGEAEALHNLAVAYERRDRSKQDRDQALEKYGQALNIYERLKDEKGIGHASSGLGKAYVRLGQYDKATECHERSLKISRKMGNEEDEERALHDLGAICQYRYQYGKAIEYTEKALAISRKLGDKRSEATNLLNIGRIYRCLGQDLKAWECFRKVLDAAQTLKDSDLEAHALSWLAHVCTVRGREDKAVQFLGRALATYESNGNVEGNGEVLSRLGARFFHWGQYDKAVEYYQKSLEISHKLGASEAGGLGALGKVYRDIGQHGRAIKYFQRSLESARKWGDLSYEGQAWIDIGGIHMQRGEYKAALETLQKGLSIWERIGRDEVWWPRFLIGNVYLDIGDIGGAKPYLDSLGNGTCGFALAGHYHLLKSDYEDAKASFEQLRKQAEHGKTRAQLFISYTGLGLAYEGMQDYPKAAELFRKAVEQAEELRSGLSAGERSQFFNVKVWGFARTEPYEGLARVLMKMNKPIEALRQSEYTKARIFAESLSRRSSQASVKVPEDVLKKDFQLNEHLASLTKKRQAAYEKRNREVVAAVEPQIKEIKSKLQAHIDMLRKQHPLFAATKYPQPMDLQQTAVKPDEWTLAYQVTDPGICMWLLEGKSLVKSVFKPVPRKELNQLVRSFRKPMDMEEITRENLLAFKDALGTGKKLFDILVGDFLDSIPEGQSLIILPDGILGVLPFEMLVIKEGTGWNTSGQSPYPEGVVYFGDRTPLSYYQSLTALTLARTLGQVKKAGLRTLVIADPVFQPDDPRLVQAERKRRQALLASVSDKLMSIKNETGLVFNRLHLTGDLGTALKKLEPEATDLHVGMDACKSLLLTEKLDKYRSVVFATHGYVGEGLPGIMEPVLVLTLVDQPKGKDGFLRMSEVMSLDLTADVVALTACQTGLGREVKGEGTMGIGRAFQYAGAKSVLMSLWSVSEVSTTKMAEKFLSYIKQGKTRLEALQRARQEIRAEGYEHPFYWAPFILVGEAK
jgi:tetratricopeptide (TPR) repeat protein